jgi:hypothetical protein
MNRPSRIFKILGLFQLLSLIACQPATTPTSTTIPLSTPSSLTTDTPTPPVPVESNLVWEVDSTSKQTIYDQAQRVAAGAGNPYFFWPDGSFTFIPVGDQYRFFAPNGSRTVRMLGTFDNPGAQLEAGKITIQGIDPEFPFAIKTHRVECC